MSTEPDTAVGEALDEELASLLEVERSSRRGSFASTRC